jgi:phosphoglycerate dehydrogenase-like enzyme
VIGSLTEAQLDVINERRIEDDLPILISEVVFVGSHIYEQRAIKQDYQIEDILDQIERVLSNTR